MQLITFSFVRVTVSADMTNDIIIMMILRFKMIYLHKFDLHSIHLPISLWYHNYSCDWRQILPTQVRTLPLSIYIYFLWNIFTIKAIGGEFCGSFRDTHTYCFWREILLLLLFKFTFV